MIGVTKSAYRVKKNPVAVKAEYCGKEIFSVGRSSSKKEAPLIIHLDMGAHCVIQKKKMNNMRIISRGYVNKT